jgi:hypothetical protein
MNRTSAAVVAEHDEQLLIKKSDICRDLRVSGNQFEKMLEAGLLPAPIWLGTTPHSRRWYASAIRHHLSVLRANAPRRPSLAVAHG